MVNRDPRFTPDELIRLVREAGEQLTQLATEIERAFAAANAMRRGQLSLIDRSALEPSHGLESRVARWVAEVLEPLERMLTPVEDAWTTLEPTAAAPTYLQDQDLIQKRMIRDLRAEVTALRAQCVRLNAMLMQSPPPAVN
ncbi:MAG: hypothetical protein FJ318_08900 [SAR202 cluster bacterium]|nr:hypothetical protein [SAR202 cluster bacterium]